MSYDLAISTHGDLIFAGNRDLQGVSGHGLIEQRMKLRLRLPRGQWQYDTDQNFGSQLYTLAGEPSEKAIAHAQLYVREALRDMNDVIVDNVIIDQTSDGRGIEVHVQYHLSEEIGATAPQLLLDLTLTFVTGE